MVKIPVFVVMGFLGLRYAPATRAQTDRRRISAVRASWTMGFEEVVRDGAFSVRTEFGVILWGSAEGDSSAQGRMRAPLRGGKWNTLS